MDLFGNFQTRPSGAIRKRFSLIGLDGKKEQRMQAIWSRTHRRTCSRRLGLVQALDGILPGRYSGNRIAGLILPLPREFLMLRVAVMPIKHGSLWGLPA